MWNYNSLLPSFMVLVVFAVYYFISPRLPIKVNISFLKLFFVEIGVISLDYFACLADDYHSIVPIYVQYILNMLYFMFFLARIYMFYRITIDLLQQKSKEPVPFIKPLRYIHVGFQLVMLSSFFTQSVFYIDEAGYHKGPFYGMIYVCFFLYLIASIVLILTQSGRLNRYELNSALSYNVVLMLGNIVRMLLPQYLIMNTFCMVALIIIYLSFENPDLYMSDRRAFNSKALEVMLNEIIGNKQFSILGFILRNYGDEREIYGGTQMDQGTRMVSKYLFKEFPATKVFYLRNGRFVLLGDDNFDLSYARAKIYDRFHQPWSADDAELYLNASFVQYKSDDSLTSTDKLVNSLAIAFDEAEQLDDDSDAVIDMNSVHGIDRSVDIKRSIEKAIENNSVEIFLQPLVDASTFKLVGAEALARIRDDSGKIIPPDEFIPIAEKNGRINAMGEQVFDKTCRFVSDNDMEKMGIRWINVNLSPIQCMRRDLGERFSAILARNKVDTNTFHLEITEQSIADYSMMQKQIKILQERGFSFVLDDYGSQYSNIARVRSFPFINIKIDKEMVWDYFRRRDNLLPTIIQVFRSMNFSITAEGIETEEMAGMLRDIGCDYLQGFFFSKPLPVDEFVMKYSA